MTYLQADDRPSGGNTARAQREHWRIEDIAYDAIDPSRIAGNEMLFHLIVSASFIESGSRTYTRNLVEHYAGSAELGQWLAEHWEPEELQHGAALARYAQTVWPNFPWQAAYDSFFDEYSRLCTVEALQSRVLEMVARCIVETGTTTYYQVLRALAQRAGEPVLADLAGRIRADEVNHYKHFLASFKTLKAAQPVSRWSVARVVGARLREMREDDSDVALRHVWQHAHAEGANLFPDGTRTFPEFKKQMMSLFTQNLPIQQAMRMALKPLMLPHRLEQWLQAPIVWFSRRQWQQQ